MVVAPETPDQYPGEYPYFLRRSKLHGSIINELRSENRPQLCIYDIETSAIIISPEGNRRFAIMYFIMIRPQQKRQKEIQKFRNSLAVGQEVITSGGVYGKISHIEDNNPVVTLEVATGVKIKVDRSCIFANAAATQEQGK